MSRITMPTDVQESLTKLQDLRNKEGVTPSDLIQIFEEAMNKIEKALPETAMSFDGSQPAPLRRGITAFFVLFYEIAKQFSREDIEVILPFYERCFDEIHRRLEEIDPQLPSPGGHIPNNFGASIATRIKLLANPG